MSLAWADRYSCPRVYPNTVLRCSWEARTLCKVNSVGALLGHLLPLAVRVQWAWVFGGDGASPGRAPSSCWPVLKFPVFSCDE